MKKVTLIKLIDSYMHDGELSDLEIYDLADWLNKNPDEMLIWPGNRLVDPLKKAWSDEKISDDERNELFQLLNEILIEHYKKEAGPASSLVVSRYRDESGNQEEPVTPFLNLGFRVNSESTPGEAYDVELQSPSCTCPDWTGVRISAPTNRIPRFCKHVLACFRSVPREPKWPDWFNAYLDLGYKSYPDQKWRITKIKGTSFLYSSANPEWGNVYCKIKNESFRYGYSVMEARWAYRKIPPSSVVLSQLIERLSSE